MHRTESLCPRFFWTIFTAFWIIYSRELKYSQKMTFHSTESRHLDKREGMLWPAISSVNFRQYVKTSRLRNGHVVLVVPNFPMGLLLGDKFGPRFSLAQLRSNRPNKRWRHQISQLGKKSTQFYDCSQGFWSLGNEVVSVQSDNDQWETRDCSKILTPLRLSTSTVDFERVTSWNPGNEKV